MMAKYFVLFVALFVGGFAFPAEEVDHDMSIFFDHTDAEARVVGGSTAANGAHPWIAAMTNGNSRSFLCGASVISADWVLTAAHCIRAVVSGSTLSRTLRITVGTNRWNSGGQTYQLSRHINHPQYNHNQIKNDIGLLRTSTRIVNNAAVRAIVVNYDFVGGGVAVRAAGWGRVRAGGSISAQLLELSKTTVDGARCRTEVQRVAASSNIRAPAVDPNVELCTFHSMNHGMCNGDSGSPLVRTSNGQQVGIVSWGIPCARGAPDMFVRVSAFRTWIQNNAR